MTDTTSETTDEKPKNEARITLPRTFTIRVKWSEIDNAYIAYCFNFVTHGRICRGETEAEAFRELAKTICDEIEFLPNLFSKLVI